MWGLSLTRQHVVVVVVFLVVCCKLLVRIQALLQLVLSAGLLCHVRLLFLRLWARRLRLGSLEATISRSIRTCHTQTDAETNIETDVERTLLRVKVTNLYFYIKN